MLATSSPKTDSQVKAMLDELRAALAKCQHDFSISFEECHTRFELQLQEKQTRVEALIVGLKTQFVTSIRDMHANLTREYNQGVSKVSEQLISRCEALTKHNENLERKIASLEASIPGLIEERISTFKASLEAMQKKIANVEGTMSQEVARAVDAMPPPPPPPDRSASHLLVMQQVEKVESRVNTLESLEPVTTAYTSLPRYCQDRGSLDSCRTDIRQILSSWQSPPWWVVWKGALGYIYIYFNTMVYIWD